MIYLLTLWIALGVVVLALVAYRAFVARTEDDTLHLRPGEASLVSHQTEIAQRLKAIDRWGKTLTVAEVLFGMVLAAFWLYAVWQESSKLQ